MDIDKVIQNLREAKKKASCPKGYKYSKKLKSCVPIRKKGGVSVRGYFGGYRGGDNRSDSGNGNGNGNGNGHGGNGNGNGGNGGGNGGGGNGGGGGE